MSTVESIFIIGTTISNDEVLSLGLEGYLMGRLELVAQVLRVCQAVAIVACENIARGHKFLIKHLVFCSIGSQRVKVVALTLNLAEVGELLLPFLALVLS